MQNIFQTAFVFLALFFAIYATYFICLVAFLNPDSAISAVKAPLAWMSPMIGHYIMLVSSISMWCHAYVQL